MAKFHTLTVSDIRTETPDTVSIAFEVPAALADDYKFIQGQYLTLKAMIGGEDVRRSYSICVSPLDGELRVAVKQVPGGIFSTYANSELKQGDALEVMTPTGNFFTPVEPEKEKNYVLFAAGSGITPIMSIMKTVLEEEPKSTVTLFYGNKKSGSIIFQEQIEDLKNSYTNRLSVNYVLSQEHPGAELFYGRITGDKCEQFATHLFDPAKVDAYFLCGPEPMIRAVASVLESKDVSKERIHFELFTSPTSIAGKTERTSSEQASQTVENAEITIILDDERSTYTLTDKKENILDSAMKQGIDVPFACKGAVCMTCRAKLLEGEASMEKNYALTDKEVEQGYILTCQAHPQTKQVVVSFDD